MIARLLCVLIGYPFGCFLTAEAVMRHVRGRSAFDVGLGNPGMANVGATIGTRWALVTLAGDVAKTLVPVLVARAAFGGELGDASAIWAGVGVTLGHNYPCWHHFSGGKGVATTCTAIILAMPPLGIAATVAGGLAVLFGKYLCVGAIVIPAAFVALACLAGSLDGVVAGLVLLGLMMLAHMPAVLGIRSGRTTPTDLLAHLRR
ncbi:MAG: glycerol-3-phosphate acyltransferase [Atopobiaceae bacterium]|nr:glycerol-3-phosphate acyltransferase [Atopobiaceae bacterium]